MPKPNKPDAKEMFHRIAGAVMIVDHHNKTVALGPRVQFAVAALTGLLANPNADMSKGTKPYVDLAIRAGNEMFDAFNSPSPTSK